MVIFILPQKKTPVGTAGPVGGDRTWEPLLCSFIAKSRLVRVTDVGTLPQLTAFTRMTSRIRGRGRHAGGPREEASGPDRMWGCTLGPGLLVNHLFTKGPAGPPRTEAPACGRAALAGPHQVLMRRQVGREGPELMDEELLGL